MAFFVLEYRYADADARTRTRGEHLAYLGALAQEGRVVLAGPIREGEGAMVVMDVEDLAAAERIVAEDPYTAAGVGADHVLRPWDVVVTR